MNLSSQHIQLNSKFPIFSKGALPKKQSDERRQGAFDTARSNRHKSFLPSYSSDEYSEDDNGDEARYDAYTTRRSERSPTRGAPVYSKNTSRLLSEKDHDVQPFAPRGENSNTTIKSNFAYMK